MNEIQMTSAMAKRSYQNLIKIPSALKSENLGIFTYTYFQTCVHTYIYIKKGSHTNTVTIQY